MKKKQRCFVKRFAALVAALVMCLALCIPCLAVDDAPRLITGDFPSLEEFKEHPNQWYLCRESSSSTAAYVLFAYAPTSWDSDGFPTSVWSISPFSQYSYTYVLAPATSSSSAYQYTYHYVNTSIDGIWLSRFPVPIGVGAASFLFFPAFKSTISALKDGAKPSFLLTTTDYVPNSGQFSVSDSGRGAFAFGDVSSAVLWYSRDWGNNHVPYGRLDHPSTYSTRTSLKPIELSSFGTSFFTLGNWDYGKFPSSVQTNSRNVRLQAVFDSTPSATAPTYNQFVYLPALYFTSGTFEMLYGTGYRNGGWFPGDDDLQNELVNQFGVDSGTLSNSKSSLDSWSNTSSIDTDVASGATGLLNGIFQNLGTFLFSVSLLCFGAVVLRMLIRKAVDG